MNLQVFVNNFFQTGYIFYILRIQGLFMKITLALIIDVIFTAFVSFILLFIFSVYFLPRTSSLALSITLSLVFSLLTFKRLSAINQKEKLRNADKKAKNFMVNQLNLYTKLQQTQLFERAINKLGYATERKKGGIFIKDKNLAVFSNFSFDLVSKTDIVKAFNSADREDIYIFCDTFSPETKSFADRFDGRIILVSSDKVYKFLKDADCMPEEKFEFSERKKLTLKTFKNLIKKEQSKRLFLFGLTLILTSYFVPIKAYYITFGGIFLSLSLICRLYGSTTQNND